MANWGNALGGGTTGALTGAASGATLGSVVPGLGTILGGSLGAILGGLGGAAPGLFENNQNKKFGEGLNQNSLYTPEQQNILSMLLQQGSQNADFGNIENLYKNQFQSQILPSIVERFTAMGAGGPSSSAFAGAVGQAGSGLASQLAALRSQYGMQQLQTGLRPQFESIYQQRQPGFGENALLSLIQAGGPAFGKYLGNYLTAPKTTTTEGKA
jgi:hypothetical protein